MSKVGEELRKLSIAKKESLASWSRTELGLLSSVGLVDDEATRTHASPQGWNQRTMKKVEDCDQIELLVPQVDIRSLQVDTLRLQLDASEACALLAQAQRFKGIVNRNGPQTPSCYLESMPSTAAGKVCCNAVALAGNELAGLGQKAIRAGNRPLGLPVLGVPVR